MPRATVTQRLRRVMKRLFDAEGHGAATRLAEFSARRPGGRHIRAQDLSYFKHATEGRTNPISLDDLDDIADFFRISIGELFEVHSKDLSGLEQRLVLGFRALSTPTQDHFLALLEAASIPAQMSDNARHPKAVKSDRTSPPESRPVAPALPLSPSDQEFRRRLTLIVDALADLAAGTNPGDIVLGAVREKP